MSTSVSRAAKLTSKGQLTVPKAVRNALGVDAGDVVEFVTNSDGQITIQAKSVPLSQLRGALPKPQEPIGLEQMDAAIRAAATRTFRSS